MQMYYNNPSSVLQDCLLQLTKGTFVYVWVCAYEGLCSTIIKHYSKAFPWSDVLCEDIEQVLQSHAIIIDRWRPPIYD